MFKCESFYTKFYVVLGRRKDFIYHSVQKFQESINLDMQSCAIHSILRIQLRVIIFGIIVGLINHCKRNSI